MVSHPFHPSPGRPWTRNAGVFAGVGEKTPARRPAVRAVRAVRAAWIGLGFLLLATLSAFAREATRMDDEWVVDTWLSSDGLPDNSVTASVADPEGYRWVGTLVGLARFAGQQFQPEPVPPHFQAWPRSAMNLWVDRRARVWLSDDQGLARRTAGRWEEWAPLGLWSATPGNARVVRSFAETADGRVYLSTLGGSLLEIRAETVTELPWPPELPRAEAVLVTDLEDRVIVLTGGRLLRWDDGSWHALAQSAGAAGEVGLGPARAGGFWWLEGARLQRWERGQVSAEVKLSEPIPEPWSLHELSDGEIWVTTRARGLFRIPTDHRVRHYGPENLLLGVSPRSVSEDDEGTRWVGGLGGGLSRFRRRALHTFESEHQAAPTDVKSVTVDLAGRIVLGAWAVGLAMRGSADLDASFRPWSIPGAPASAFSVLANREGRVWAGFSGGALWRQTAEGFAPVWTNEVVGRDIRALFEDRQGRIWAGGPRGVASVEAAGKVTEFPLGLDSSVIALAQDSASDELWVATALMVHRGGGQGFQRDLALEQFVNGSVSALRADPAGGLWVGTVGQGLIYWRDGRGRRIEATGFRPEAIWGFEFDAATNLWLTTPQGVVSVERSSLSAAMQGESTRLEWRRFGPEEGLTCGACMSYSQPTIARAPDGRLWIAAARGVAVIDPATVATRHAAPSLRFDRVVYDQVNAGGGRPVSHVLSLPGTREEVRLPPGSRRIEIRFDVLSLAAPERVRTEVRLEGVDQDWVDNGGMRWAQYTDPAPGRYRFRVRACNPDGVWNDSGLELRFVIAPFYWQTAWFRWGGAGAAILGTAGLTWWLNRRRWWRQLELTRLRQRLAHVLENTSEGVVFLTPQGRVQYLNRAASEMIGRGIVEAGEAADLDYFEIFDAESGEVLRNEALPALEKGGSWEGETVMTRADGGVRWLAQTWMAHRDAAGRLEFVSGLVRDVTDRRRAEGALRTSHARLTFANQQLLGLARSRELHEGNRAAALARLVESAATTVDVARASVWLIEGEPRQLRCLDQVDRSTGEHSTQEAIAAADFPAYFRALETERFIDAEDARTDPRTREFVASFLVPQGITSMLDAPVRVGGRVIGVLCLEHSGPLRRWTPEDEFLAAAHADLVALALENAGRHEAETALRELNASLERRVAERTAELAASNEKLQELDRLKSEFLATMSHELRTPLNSIIGFTGILKAGLAGEVNAEQKKQLEMVNRSAKHLLNLINDLLDLSRIEAGRMEVHWEVIPVGAVLEEVERMLAPIAAGKGLRVRTEIEQSELALRTDRRKLFQIVLNLVGNAVKFTEQGEVVIAAGPRDGYWVVEVRDTGPGVKPENMPCLFEAFRQVDGSARRHREGAGLGLYLCRKLTGLLQGEITAVSEYGRGSTFRFRLPLA